MHVVYRQYDKSGETYLKNEAKFHSYLCQFAIIDTEYHREKKP